MLNKAIKTLLLAVSVWLFVSCDEWPSPNPDRHNGLKEAYAPIYFEDVINKLLQPKDSGDLDLTKMTRFGKYLLCLDYGKGLVVFDTGDSTNLYEVKYYSLPFATDFHIIKNHLYCNVANGLQVVDISDVLTAKAVAYVPNIETKVYADYPPATNVVFECIEKDKGEAISWELRQVQDPQCYRK
jgi:hypothetical protein